MIRRNFLFILLYFFLSTIALAQDKKEWNNKRCAVVLTYDDALNVHLDKVIPALDSVNLKATFYLSGFFPGCKNRLEDWRKAAHDGHELGNHTMFHPCIGQMQGREFVKPDYDLKNYSLQRIEDEIKSTNVLLESLDGKMKRTFAYPCGDMTVGKGTSYVDKITDGFVAARGVQGRVLQKNNIDFFNMGSFFVSGQSGKELIDIAKAAMKQNGLVVFLFHGVGGEHSINASLKDHNELLKFLKENEKDIWVAPLVDVVEYVKAGK